MQYVRYQVQSCQFPWHWRGFQHQALADDFADLSPKSSCQMPIEKKKGRLTSSAASACTIANSINRAISSRLPVIARSPLSNRLRAILPRVPLRVRSLSESSAESDEYNSALPCKVPRQLRNTELSNATHIICERVWRRRWQTIPRIETKLIEMIFG